MKDLIIIDCEQGSKEWFEARKGRFTGSDAVDLIYEPGVYKTGEKKGLEKPIPEKFINLVEEKSAEVEFKISQHEIDTRVGRCVYPNYKPSIGINGEYGKIMESEALEHYSLKYSEEIYTVGFVVSKQYQEHLGVSPDALHILKHSGVETKCPVTAKEHRKHLKLKTASDLKEANEKYYWQVLSCIFVCEADSWDFVSYFPFIDPELVMSCLAVKRDEVKEDLELFETCVKKAIKLKELSLNTIEA